MQVINWAIENNYPEFLIIEDRDREGNVIGYYVWQNKGWKYHETKYVKLIEWNLNIRGISGQLENKKSVKVFGKKYTWYINAGVSNLADHIYVVTDDKNGFAGQTISFTLLSGVVEEIVGPWKTNPDALFEDTGLDIRDLHFMKYIIAEEKEEIGWLHSSYSGVLDSNLEGGLMNYNYPQEQAKFYANKLRKRIWYSYQSEGGAGESWVEPISK